jgi:hypothetical protein
VPGSYQAEHVHVPSGSEQDGVTLLNVG